MNRDQMVEKAAEGIASTGLGCCDDCIYKQARAVLDAILPQVTTVAELEALRIDHDSLVVTAIGETRRAGAVDEHDFKRGPLTVVWQPEVDR